MGGAPTRGSIIHRTVSGHAAAIRAHRLRFPAHTVADEAGTLAEIGRFGWLRIFFGPGQRIRLSDGAEWRLKAVGRTRYICPLIVDARGRRVAEAAPGIKRSYGINGPDYAYMLYPADAALGRPLRWILRDRETNAAVLSRRPLSVDAAVPVPLPAVLLAFVVAKLGIPGEAFLHAPRAWKA